MIFSEVTGYTMVGDQRYKPVVEADACMPVEMYDLLTDPDELVNIVNDECLHDTRQSLIDNHLQKFRAAFNWDAFQSAGKIREVMPRE